MQITYARTRTHERSDRFNNQAPQCMNKMEMTMLWVKRKREMPLFVPSLRARHTNCPYYYDFFALIQLFRCPIANPWKVRLKCCAWERILWILNCCGVRTPINIVLFFSSVVDKYEEKKVKYRKSDFLWGLHARERHCHCHRRCCRRRYRHFASFNRRVCFTMEWKTTRE